MPTIHFEYVFGDAPSGPPVNRVTAALRAVDETGSLAGAAGRLGLSYRRLWDLMKEWEERFGMPLLERGRGRRGKLSPAARRWLAAEREVLADHAEAIARLEADLERSFACAVREDLSVIRLSGCPDEALLLLRQEALKRDFLLEVEFNSSLAGLQELAAGACDVAGFNFPLGVSPRGGLPREFRRFLEDDALVTIRFARRIQGLAVAPGNPLGIRSMLDVGMKGARYVNRAPGTGTRILCDTLLRSAGMRPDEVRGYGVCATSHEAVAARVALGKADAGLCIESVAARAGVGFIPLVREDYLLACRKDFLGSDPGAVFLEALRTGAWRERAAELAGYDFSGCGACGD